MPAKLADLGTGAAAKSASAALERKKKIDAAKALADQALYNALGIAPKKAK